MSSWPDLSEFTPHGFCLAWEPGLIWLTAASNLLIALAYFSIPAALLVLALRRRDIEYVPLLVLFAAFILSCGTTHVFGALTLWIPVYWASAMADALTAILSVATAILLWPLIPRLLALPSPTALQKANGRLQNAEAATAQANRWLSMGEQLAHVGHWRHNRGDGRVWWSDELFRIFGLENRGGAISHDLVRKACPPGDWAAFREAAADALRRRAGFDIAGRVIRPSGEVRHVRVRGEVLVSPAGGPISLFGICVDRTEQAEVERELDLARTRAEDARAIVEKLALQDSLTGLANRRQFDQALDQEFRRARRLGNHLALIMLDVDHFKSFNDAYGHPAGDDCLRAIAGALPGPLRRPGDLAARYGGEEFAAILPGADLQAAGDIADQIVRTVRGLAIRHDGAPGGIVTISAGVASCLPMPQDGDPLRLVQCADHALYKAKMQGRNQVYAEPEAPPDRAFASGPAATPDAYCAPADPTPQRDWTTSHVLRREQVGSAPDGGFDLASVLDAFPYGVVLTDATQPNHPVVSVNAGFSALTGYQPRELLGRQYDFLRGQDTDPEAVSELEDATRRGTPIRRELLSYRKDGLAFRSEVFLKPLKDAAGRLFGFLGTQRDLDGGALIGTAPAAFTMPAGLNRIAILSPAAPGGSQGAKDARAALDHDRQRVILQRSLQREAIETQFSLLYHPLVELSSGRILGAEALLRWNHPELGAQGPGRFIPKAETSGLIVPLGAWVFRTALRELADWQPHGGGGVRVSINVSSVQLRDPGFLTMVEDALRETRIDPCLVDIELTETGLIEANAATLSVLEALKKRGFQLALDDFGTGYSSFRCLQDLPIDKIKIDQTFVRRVTLDSGEDAIVRAMLSVTKRLGVGATAEGIETPGQRAFLCREGCMVGQGYLYSLPLPASEFRQLLGKGRILPVAT